MNYYNDFDANAAQWLKNLIAAGLLPAGVVDSRPIQEVTPSDLSGFTQCHFFAGIGGWSLALAIAGWRTDEPVWTGSCPCQPFSVAGKGAGTDDPRHLWPEFRRLIADCKPPTVFGEQVASKDGRNWLAGVRSDLETMGYAVGATDLCAAGSGTEESILLVGPDGYRRESVHLGPAHIRQRLCWVADSRSAGTRGYLGAAPSPETRGGGAWGADGQHGGDDAHACGADGRLADSENTDRWGRERGAQAGIGAHSERGCGLAGSGADGRLADSPAGRLGEYGRAPGHTGHPDQCCEGGSNWLIIPCADGKARRIEPGIAPLVDGLPGRVGQIRGYGNAINPQIVAEFIAAYLECRP